MAGAFAGGGDAIVAVDQRHSIGKIIVADPVAGNGVAPEAAFILAAPRIGEDHRQGHLAIAEIIALPLAHFGRGGIIVDGVIDQLEGNAQIAAIGIKCAFIGLAAFGNHRRNAAGGGEQRGGLGADD